MSVGDVGSAEIWEALSVVRDPELDESITELGFVGEVTVEDRVARVRLRLPTFFCAANFAYLMVHDAREALKPLPGLREVDVQLDDHFASDEINEGVASERGFQGTFEGLADGDLDELRRIFRRKALIARQDRLARRLMAEGYEAETLTTMRVGDLPDGEETQEYLRRRAELGVDTGPDAPFLINVAGHAVPAEDARGFLRQGRTTRLSIEANAGFCRAVLQARYRDAPGPAGEKSAAPPPGAEPSDRKGAST